MDDAWVGTGVKMETGKIEFSPMSEGTAQNILKRLDRLITLMEEQNDIMLYDACKCEEDDGNRDSD